MSEQELKERELKERYELDLALALSASLSAADNTPTEDTESVAAQVRKGDREYMVNYGRTGVIDPGSYFSVTTRGASTAVGASTASVLLTNKCAMLAVWVALFIQDRLRLCAGKTPFIGAMKFTNPYELYLEFRKLLLKCPQFSGSDYSRDDRFNRDWFGLIANIIGQNIYVWDIEARTCLKFYPRDCSGTLFDGSAGRPDLESIDPARRIILVYAPGHIMVVAATFALSGLTYQVSKCTEGICTEGICSAGKCTLGCLYSRCNDIIAEIPERVFTTSWTVTIPKIGPIRNLSSSVDGLGRSFVQFPEGVVEPLYAPKVNDDLAFALALHGELNGKDAHLG